MYYNDEVKSHEDISKLAIECDVSYNDILSELSPKKQKKIMKEWFFKNYIKPANGIRYYALEIFYNEFKDIVDDDVINKVVEAFEKKYPEWISKSTEQWQEYYLEAIFFDIEPYHIFNKSIRQLKLLLKTNVAEEVQQIFLGFLYVNIITILETYLSDMFFKIINADKKFLKMFVESYEDFRKEEFTYNYNEIYRKYEAIEEMVQKRLIKKSWHNLVEVRRMYSHIGIKLPEVGSLLKDVSKRHLLVHRNGKTDDGEIIEISRTEIEELIQRTQEFVSSINTSIIKREEEEADF